MTIRLCTIPRNGLTGRRLAAHAWTAAGAHNAAEAGVTSMEHLWSIEDADLELAIQYQINFPPSTSVDTQNRPLMDS